MEIRENQGVLHQFCEKETFWLQMWVLGVSRGGIYVNQNAKVETERNSTCAGRQKSGESWKVLKTQ